MTHHLHMVARSLGVSDSGAFSCCLCGDSCFSSGGSLGDNFADCDALVRPDSRSLCAGCTRILSGRPGDDPPPLRTRSFIATDTEPTILDRVGFWSALTSPPPGQFVLSWATGGQKHHVLRAGLSTSRRMLIGADDGQIDFVPARESVLMNALLSMLAKSPSGKQYYTRTAILDGDYHPNSINAFGRERHAASEVIISTYRRGRRLLLGLLLWCCPSEERAVEVESEQMVDPHDDRAANLIAALASGSEMRANDGMRFWSGLLERRVQRFSRLPIRDFVSRLMTEIQVSPSSQGAVNAADMIDRMTSEMEEAVSKSIRERSSLVIAMAFARRKDAR